MSQEYREGTSADRGEYASQVLEPADHQYDGVFLFLYIVGVVLGLVWLLSAAVGMYGLVFNVPAFQFNYVQTPSSLASGPHYERVALPVCLLAMGLLFVVAALFRGSFGRRLLFFAAIVMVILRLFSMALTIPAVFAPGVRSAEPPVWQLVTMVGALILSLTYPALCIVAVCSWRRNSAT